MAAMPLIELRAQLRVRPLLLRAYVGFVAWCRHSQQTCKLTMHSLAVAPLQTTGLWLRKRQRLQLQHVGT